MGILTLIDAVRGSRLAGAWYRIELLEAGGGTAPGGTDSQRAHSVYRVTAGLSVGA
jgi:hypothetical protein